VGEGIIMAKITSPGHKLGQLIGNFFEEFFSSRLINLAEELGVYCDKKGRRPKVRGKKKKVTWTDDEGNVHDMDYVFERNGTRDKKGESVAFIELAWRRYTKHSRNKAGEIQAALVPLGNTYRNTCNFLGAILGGEFTEGALKQLASHHINVLYIPYTRIVEAFLVQGVNLDYPEDATNQQKYEIIEAWEALSQADIEDIKQAFAESIQPEYEKFVRSLKSTLLRRIEKIRILPLFGNEMVFTSIGDAIVAIEKHDMIPEEGARFCKFEIYVHFTNGDKIEGSFQKREEALKFLKIYME
jgi:hypothetical protein